MARLRGARADATPLPVPGPNIEGALAAAEVAFDTGHVPAWARPIPHLPLAYTDAMQEARQMCRNLGLDIGAGSEASLYDLGSLIRYVYAQGWLACETRLASPNMADAIDLAITTPAAIVEQNAGESIHRWTIRAIQQAVAHDTRAEPH